MTIDDLDPNIRAWLFACEALRRLGFLSDQIFIEVQTNGRVLDADTRTLLDHGVPVISCVLLAQSKRFTWIIGAIDMEPDEIRAAHAHAVEIWNTQPDHGATDRLWRTSGAFAKRFELVAALRQKGFLVPHVAT